MAAVKAAIFINSLITASILPEIRCWCCHQQSLEQVVNKHDDLLVTTPTRAESSFNI